MAHLGKAIDGSTGHLPGETVGTPDAGERLLDGLVAALQRVIFGVRNLRIVPLEIGGVGGGDQPMQPVELNPCFRLGIALDLTFRTAHVTSEISFPAAARASSVTVAPASIRATSSWRATPASGRTWVRMNAPSFTDCFSISRWLRARAAT